MPHAAPFAPVDSPAAASTPQPANTAPQPAPSRLVGVTMRLWRQEKTGDVHDALSADWGRFLAAAGVRWLPLPNRGEETLALAKALGVGGLIFSGGGDVGMEPTRDCTEGLLLAWARRQNLPVLGVCRGFQALQWHLGGELTPVRGHVATRHALWKPDVAEAALPTATSPLAPWLFRQGAVNSFHNMGIERLAGPLRPLALSRDAAGLWHVEAAQGQALLGLMWHPEREAVPCMEDVALVREFFVS